MPNQTYQSHPERVTSLSSKKGKATISALTAYDYPTAKILDETGIDLILVGDSLGMVVLGHNDTTEVTIEMMTHHTSACRPAVKNAALVADLPYKSYDTPEKAVITSNSLVNAGADGVKLEGGTEIIPQINAIIDNGIPVIGHVGLLPQSIKIEGSYKKKGKSPDEYSRILSDAMSLEKAGAVAIVLENIVSELASEITNELKIPTIGIGSGIDCNGQIRVIHDITGFFPWFTPSFADPLCNIANEISSAVEKYIKSI
ncbi:MAG: 3-methyl-2-oxobutanoate hydroxymethyltransferase [Verrucomicrobiota bacterium]|nr:3-methyl-2-oxobutanoate hydroxymethyltransferase [Verrucomicrobiota bacterium]MEC8906157.1 3-methyl-2-oxobutanoate hydroxymethyltransferase [Verrucomicrobiota bacterium]